MKINILVNRVFSGWTPTDTRLGGTEESIVRWGQELTKLGHEVTVYQNGFEGEHQGVRYLNREHYAGGGDVCLNIKSSDVRPIEPTLYLTNETNATDLDLSAYDGVIWPSSWAAMNIPVNNPNVYILPHGYDPTVIFHGRKINKQCLYASSPDRGLDKLLEVWPEVYAEHPDATLIVTYGASVSLPGVICLGDVDEDTMNELYRTSDVWCHPCSGGELFGITGIKAQAAGCVPVIIPTMALQETVRQGVFAESKTYKDMLINTLHETEARERIRTALALETYPTWQSTALELEKLLLKTAKK